MDKKMYEVIIENKQNKEEQKNNIKYKSHIYFDTKEEALKYMEIQKQTAKKIEKIDKGYKYIDPLDNTEKIIIIKKIHKYDLMPKLEKDEVAICQSEGGCFPKVVVVKFKNRNAAKKFLKLQIEGRDLWESEYEDNILYKNDKNVIKYAIKNNAKLKDVDKEAPLLTIEGLVKCAIQNNCEVYEGEDPENDFYIIVANRKITFVNTIGRKYIIIYYKNEKESGYNSYLKLTDSLKTVKKFAEQYKCPDFLEEYK